MFKKSGRDLEVVADQKEQLTIIQCIHSGIGTSKESKALGGHLGWNTVANHLSTRYFWPRITQDVKKYIKSCTECQRNKVSNLEKGKQTLQPIPVPQGVWQQIGIDLMGPFPESPEGHLYVFTAIDYFSKWVELFALKDKTAESVGNCLFSLMCRYGPAKIHITDQGREFCNAVSDRLYGLTGLHHRITGAYHPQANGLCERQNASTLTALRKSVQDQPSDWYKLLDAIAYSFRASRRRATGRSPFEIMFGRKVTLPVDLLHNKPEGDDISEEEARNLEKQLESEQQEVSQEEVFESAKAIGEEIFKTVSRNIAKEQSVQKDYFDRRHQAGKPLEVGTKVMKRNMMHSGRKGGKMDYQFMGPYTILSVDAKKSRYTLMTEEGKVLAQQVNASNLKLYHNPQEEFPHLDLPDAPANYKSRQPKKRPASVFASSQGSAPDSAPPSSQESATASQTSERTEGQCEAEVSTKEADWIKVIPPPGPAGRMEFNDEEDVDMSIVIGCTVY